ncbi:glutamate-5-semialdehyde dehydrogenase [Candidatus Desantisbacteria bacterium CG2_30_40_21]|uniref:Gamma-glutamyl phosphate reductase n=5 Tax=unclassified Candidatus Desantisiibacteriota TaxID=3106372 RepID=A0A2M7JEJ2_9BACT|nr:MAG: glutamate-5-semialdehyde dehydrogenase [Candidatus Desantisbacteria bacterium CG2_30_40_21]PIP41794.1 MAG: glutamate-5-semialdehyde dehydrogenase [Candidatus Desantisbacteria bacterium CG23_combo_of_CG06-09_8_20_14_all_40_23]PIX17800.1 MAG: glutamate-5-semialdehyde dehydrogenase [Candidatus Desantisbacteria bacterium CG_4_8_14_3_um_filter_40_12]PIY20127.1 MAG: glutamate-5-semialdehyde dehydrogenase [Candidatus Desantisbacteria bacterium CG_4_10_14_3_um_filter_40_18]PJB29731.1 MAG: gluta
MSIKDDIISMATQARQASRKLANLSSMVKNDAILSMAEALLDNLEQILEENRKDLDNAKERGLSAALVDRLALNEKRVMAMAAGLRDIAALPDPIGEIGSMCRRPNGLQIGKMRVPLGVIGIIYEARPNVTADAAGLCFKSGNAVILRGGSEAINSNKIIASTLDNAATSAGVPQGSISLIKNTDRQAVRELVKLNGLVDVIILRGGKSLIETIGTESSVPIISHGAGNCHVFVDKDAAVSMAMRIVFNAKVQRPGVCNAMESLLVHKDIAMEFLPEMIGQLKGAGVEVRGCTETRGIVPDILEATEEDWGKEYLDLILSIKVVSSLDEAIEHIHKYGSSHSEAIVTSSYANSARFLQEIDAAAVYVNASTRFTDGGEFGLGAEMGISTQKLHARGPMGLCELTTTKFIILGNGQIRE